MYTKTVHVDKAVQFPNRYKDQNNVQYTFTPDNGTITQAGTAENATVFNNIEQGIFNNLILSIMGAI